MESLGFIYFDLIDEDGCKRDNGQVLLNPNDIETVIPHRTSHHHFGHGVTCGAKITMRTGAVHRVSESVPQIKEALAAYLAAVRL